MQGYGEAAMSLTASDFPPGVMAHQMSMPGNLEFLQMHMAGLTANASKQVQMQAQLEQQAATQLQMQAQLEQQAALIQWLQMNGSAPTLDPRLLPDTSFVPTLSQQPQKVHLDATASMSGSHSALPLQQPGLTLRLAAAGVGNHLTNGSDELMPNSKSKLPRAPGGGQQQAKQARQKAGAAGAVAAAQKQAEKSQDSMRSYLSDLRNEDPKRVFIARRIKDLGFRSKELLKQHFSKYGEVKQVLIPHTKVKPFRDAVAGSPARTRPGNFGLVVMSSQEVVQQIFEEGNEHMINGVQIEVQVFELVSRPQEREPQEEGEAEPEPGTPPDKEQEGASPPSSEEQEVGESRSGGCTEEQPSSSNGQPTNAETEKSPFRSHLSETEKSNGGDVLPMSVGDWRQSRATSGNTSTPMPAPKEAVQETSVEDMSQSSTLTLQAVLSVISRLSQEPSKVDLANEMTQTVLQLLSPENEGQVENIQVKLAKCLRMAADRLRAEADTLQASALAPPGMNAAPPPLPPQLALELLVLLRALPAKGRCPLLPPIAG
jgi:hypothetical protein